MIKSASQLLRSLYSQTDSLLRRPASRGDNLPVACLQVLLEPRVAAVDIRRKARPPFTVEGGGGIENHHGLAWIRSTCRVRPGWRARWIVSVFH